MTTLVERSRGKTKIILVSESDPTTGYFRALDQVTWDNVYREPMPGKGIWSTTTTVNMFELLTAAGMPVAYVKQVDAYTFRGPLCRMISLEVIVREVAEAHSSYLKRHPEHEPGSRFATPAVEFFLKTDTPMFAGIALPDVDPFIGHYAPDGIVVHHPKKPPADGTPVDSAALGWDQDGMWPFERIESIARDAFLIARDAWKAIGFDLLDWKVEFGTDHAGTLLLADVIDNDSWRIRGPDGAEYSKQNIRNGKDLADAAKDYQFIAERSALMLAHSRRPSDS